MHKQFFLKIYLIKHSCPCTIHGKQPLTVARNRFEPTTRILAASLRSRTSRRKRRVAIFSEKKYIKCFNIRKKNFYFHDVSRRSIYILYKKHNKNIHIYFLITTCKNSISKNNQKIIFLLYLTCRLK